MPRSTETKATVIRAYRRKINQPGSITRRFRSAVSGEQEREQFRGSLRVQGSSSGQAQKPIRSEFGWEIEGRPQRSVTPIQNSFGWWMRWHGNGWAVCPAVTMEAPIQFPILTRSRMGMDRLRSVAFHRMTKSDGAPIRSVAPSTAETVAVAMDDTMRICSMGPDGSPNSNFAEIKSPREPSRDPDQERDQCAATRHCLPASSRRRFWRPGAGTRRYYGGWGRFGGLQIAYTSLL